VLPDGWFHVYCRGVAGVVVFPDGDDRTMFFRELGRGARMHRWRIEAACVMSTHYHVVLAAHLENLSKGMHRLNWRYARYFNERHERFGHVFAERFQTRAIDHEDRLYDTCTYVLLNPVKARLCERVEEWPWSYSRYGLSVS
jgi:putative transposase